jgi:tRNA-binding protein
LRVVSVEAEIDYGHFAAVDMRVGRVIEVEDFPEANKPAWKLRIDFGPELGIRTSSARITNYTREQLDGVLVAAVVNFPPRQIGPARSEVLVLGAVGDDERVALLRADPEAAPGERIA